MSVDDEFDRIADENESLRGADWAKLQVFSYDGLGALMPLETYLGHAERLQKGLQHPRMSVAEAFAGIELLEWPIQVHLVYYAIEEFRQRAEEEGLPEDRARVNERFGEMLDYHAGVQERRPQSDSE